MSWPFLLIVIPLLRYTKIHLYCGRLRDSETQRNLARNTHTPAAWLGVCVCAQAEFRGVSLSRRPHTSEPAHSVPLLAAASLATSRRVCVCVCVCVRKSADWSKRNGSADVTSLYPNTSLYPRRKKWKKRNLQRGVLGQHRRVFSVLELYSLQGVLWGFVTLHTVYMQKNLHNTQGDG